MIGVELADHGDGPISARGVDAPAPGVEPQVVHTAGDRDAGDDPARVAIHDHERRLLTAADEEPVVRLVDRQ